MDGRAFRLEGALEVGLGELEDELEEELEDELEELEKLKELEEDVGGDVVVVEGLWTFLGLSQPNLLKPLTGRAWGAGAFCWSWRSTSLPIEFLIFFRIDFSNFLGLKKIFTILRFPKNGIDKFDK